MIATGRMLTCRKGLGVLVVGLGLLLGAFLEILNWYDDEAVTHPRAFLSQLERDASAAPQATDAPRAGQLTRLE